MKYTDLKYYIYKDFGKNLDEINYISLSKDIYYLIAEEVDDTYIKNNDRFIYDDFIFRLEKSFTYDKYMIIYTKFSKFGYGYNVLTENERIIKEIIE